MRISKWRFALFVASTPLFWYIVYTKGLIEHYLFAITFTTVFAVEHLYAEDETYKLKETIVEIVLLPSFVTVGLFEVVANTIERKMNDRKVIQAFKRDDFDEKIREIAKETLSEPFIINANVKKLYNGLNIVISIRGESGQEALLEPSERTEFIKRLVKEFNVPKDRIALEY